MLRFVVPLFCWALLALPPATEGKSAFAGHTECPGQAPLRAQTRNATRVEPARSSGSGFTNGISARKKGTGVFGIGNVHMGNSKNSSVVNQTEIRHSTIIIDNR